MVVVSMRKRCRLVLRGVSRLTEADDAWAIANCKECISKCLNIHNFYVIRTDWKYMMLNDINSVESKDFLSSLQKAILNECQQIVEPSDMSRANVLDIGCGHGLTTTQIVECFPNVREVLGIDSDPKAIGYAFSYVADEKMDFANANIEDQTTFDLKWASKFDWVFSSHALLFAKDHASSLRNLMWCLKPGGRCFVAVPAEKPEDFHAATKKVLAADSWKKHFQAISQVISDMIEFNCNRLWFHHPSADRVYSALLEQVGYQVLNTKLLDFNYTFSTNEEYKECLECLLRVPLQYLPEEKRAAFLKDFHKAAMKKAKKNSKGLVTWNIKYAIVLAKRPEL